MLAAFTMGARGFRSSWPKSARNSSLRRSASCSRSREILLLRGRSLELRGALTTTRASSSRFSCTRIPASCGSSSANTRTLARSRSGITGTEHVIDRARLHSRCTQVDDRSPVHRRDEDDRRLLKARMLADHRGQLEPVEVRHADVHEDDRDMSVLRRCSSASLAEPGLDEVLAELAEDRLVGRAASRAGRRPAGC